ncbi:MAG: hypothetical protein JW760_00810, partial [Spirochaetales bacterium]|nr:hypothetical protein [Spirochaetales bacterium]
RGIFFSRRFQAVLGCRSPGFPVFALTPRIVFPIIFSDYPQLSDRLIDMLSERHISIIGIDFAGVRRGAEHTPKDRYCAERGTFIVENLCNLASVLDGRKNRFFTAHTYPVKFAGMSGLPLPGGGGG